MICNLIRLIVLLHVFSVAASRCDAAVIGEYNLRNLGAINTTGPLGTSFSQTQALIDGTLSFSASLVVTGSAEIHYLAGSSGGIGVNGNTLNGNLGSESLRFTILLSHAPGISVTFNGFTELGLSNFGGSDLAVLSRDNDFFTTSDNFTVDSTNTLLSTPVPGTPSAFTVFSVLDTQSFLVASVKASFTATAAAVPEPSAFAAIAMAALATPLVRRFRRRSKSIDSGSEVA